MRATRTSPRYAHGAAISISVQGKTLFGRTANLSYGGVCAEIPVELPLGAEVDVDIELELDNGAHTEPLCVMGRVVWCTSVDNANQVGLAFCHLQRDESETLALFLRFLDRNRVERERQRKERTKRRTTIDDRFGDH